MNFAPRDHAARHVRLYCSGGIVPDLAHGPHQDSSTRLQTRPILVASSTGTVTSANLGGIYYSIGGTSTG